MSSSGQMDGCEVAALADDAHITPGSFSDAVRAGLMVNATRGEASLAALQSVGAEALAGKVLLGVSNELVPVPGGFPAPVASPGNSLGLRLQEASRRRRW